jgi:cytosine permease
MSESSYTAAKGLDKLYEFEREPVSKDKLQPGKYFAGLFAGEHVAGTEFVIGALFVAWGVRTYDIIIGLLLGNLLAVLTWTFVCAPIAVKTRLTLYWFLRKVAGPVATTVYNILNALLFMVLAGCMITVSASAVRIPFGIPAQTHWYPEDFRFVLVVFGVGAVVVTLAILGFKKLAQFASVCSPWMFLMFIAGALATLPGLVIMSGSGGLSSMADFWELADRAIWTGSTPNGSEPLGFWQVAAFAWICNLAMHGGLSDMALFRYAKSHWYGLYSAFGMYLGHYLAWICAGIMGAATALAAKTVISQVDAGGVAMYSLGISGAIAVVIAGWTTSNPTLYRAGLAFQAVTPGWPRWLVTLAVGIVTTIVASFPFVFTRLLDFVGYYGLLLMPVGAIAFTEFWIFPKFGLTQYWVSKKKILFSWPALVSWVISIAMAITLEQTGTLHLFFLFVPTWIVTVVLYLLFSTFAGARDKSPEIPEENLSETESSEKINSTSSLKSSDKRDIFMILSGIVALLALASCLFLSLWVFIKDTNGYQARFDTFKSVLIWPTLVYFISGTYYLIKRDKQKT